MRGTRMKAAIVAGLCALALLLAAYGCGQDVAAPQAEPEHRLTYAEVATPVSLPSASAEVEGNLAPTGRATPQPAATATPAPTSTPLAAASPSAPHVLPDLFSGGPGGGAASGGDVDTASVEDVLAQGLRLAGASPVHIAFRGAAAEDSVRCEWRGIARTPKQREAAMRFWLGLDADAPLPSPAEAERRFIAELDRMNAVYPATLKANFSAIAMGGLTIGYVFLTCYADYVVSEYVVGSGPTGASNRLPVAYDRMGEARSYELYKAAHAGGEFGSEALMSEGEYAGWLSQIVSDVESVLGVVLGSREAVVFLAPMGAHNAIAVEAWQAVAQWDVQRADGRHGERGALRRARGRPRAHPDARQAQEPRHGGHHGHRHHDAGRQDSQRVGAEPILPRHRRILRHHPRRQRDDHLHARAAADRLRLRKRQGRSPAPAPTARWCATARRCSPPETLSGAKPGSTGGPASP